jgi:Holliday junction resolvase RusA-like endonuclease
MLAFSFRVVGTPKPKARPRTVRNRHTGFVQTYTPATTVNWEQTIVAQVRQALAEVIAVDASETDVLPASGRIVADVQFYVKKPKSAPKSVEYPMKAQPGDVDNLAKSVLDALQLAGVIDDDKTVTDLSASKRFVDDEHDEGVEVHLTVWLN